MKTKAFTLVEVMIIVVIVGLLLAMFIPACQAVSGREQRFKDQYKVWCKINHRTDLTFEEWKTAYHAGYLSQPEKK